MAVDGAGNIHDKMLNKILKDLLPNASLVQSVYFTPRELQEQNEKKIACQLRFKSVFSEPDRVAIAEVQELGLTKELILDMRAVNRSQAIAGHAHILPGATPMAFFMSADRKVLLLNSLHGRLGYAHDINEASQVVGGASVAGGGLHAFVWSEQDGLQDLGTLGGQSSIAASINDHGVIVGTSGPQPAEQAFIWNPEQTMKALFPEFSGWSRAYKINNAGWVIGWRGHGHPMDCSYVWSCDFEAVELRISPGRPFFASAINDSGLVVGEGDDEFGNRRPYCWTMDTGVKRLETDEPFHPCAVDSRGIIIGCVSAGAAYPWTRPFIVTPAQELLPLPYAEEHNTTPEDINSTGTIVGSAHRADSWKHIHPIIWRLTI